MRDTFNLFLNGYQFEPPLITQRFMLLALDLSWHRILIITHYRFYQIIKKVVINGENTTFDSKTQVLMGRLKGEVEIEYLFHKRIEETDTLICSSIIEASYLFLTVSLSSSLGSTLLHATFNLI